MGSEGSEAARAAKAAASDSGTRRSTRVPPWGVTSVRSLTCCVSLGLGRQQVTLQMKAAFVLLESAPASRARILPVGHGGRAGPAADARVAGVVQRVVRHVV